MVDDKIKDTMRLNPVLLRRILISQDCPVFVHCLAEFESFIIAIRIESCNPRITVPVVDQKTIVIPQGVRGIPCRVTLCNLFVSKRRYYRVKMCVGPRLRYLYVDFHSTIIYHGSVICQGRVPVPRFPAERPRRCQRQRQGTLTQTTAPTGWWYFSGTA